MTDHNIPRTVPRPLSPSGKDLVAFLGTADDRARGIAYAELDDRRAREYWLRAQLADAEVCLRLAALEQNAGRAVVLYEAVLKTKPADTVALVNLGALYAGSGRTDEAVQLWERVQLRLLRPEHLSRLQKSSSPTPTLAPERTQ